MAGDGKTPKVDSDSQAKGNVKKEDKKKEAKKEEMSEEDQAKKAELDLLAERVRDADPGVQKLALDTLSAEIRSSTSSMTSVPKPLKFLRAHYDPLKEFYAAMQPSPNKVKLADILAILAMTMSPDGKRESLNFKLQGETEALGAWGHEFVRNLAGEIGAEFNERTTAEPRGDVTDLLKLVRDIVPYHMKHNAEPEACDLLMEVDLLPEIKDMVDKDNFKRVCLYLTSCATYVAEPEDSEILKVVCDVFRLQNQLPDAARIAIRLGDQALVSEIFESATDIIAKKQIAFLLARNQLHLPQSDDDNINAILNNDKLSENFLALGRDLDVHEAKVPEDIYKSHLTEGRSGVAASVDSARQNLASTFVNAFVNCGFCHDKLMTVDEKWLHKNKDHGMMSAAASLGLILLWDVDEGLSQIDKYLYSTQEYIKAGALLAVGIVNSGVRNECDPALALLSDGDALDSKQPIIRTGAIVGLGLAYAGSCREEVQQLLAPIVADAKQPVDIWALSALSLGMVFIKSANTEVADCLVAAILERDAAEGSLNDTMTRFACVAIGLVYLGHQEKVNSTLERLSAMKGDFAQYCKFTVEGCAYAGSGNVLKVQQLLSTCSDHLDDKNAHQAVAALSIALVSMGEELGADMSIRQFDHMLQYGEPNIRRAVPLGLGLLNISNPRVTVMDTLSKLTHDADAETAQCAIFALGLIGAGTNNSRIAGLLRQLAAYYVKEQNHLFIVRIAQGLLHIGKGLLTLSPMYSDRLLLSSVGLAGLVVVLHAHLDVKNIILGKYHYLLYFLATSMYPRMLVTVDENLKPLPVSVRVGQAVDIVGQAGRPKSITGFQTHTTPVLLMYGDRAELATDEYLPATPVLEGFVILKKNPDFVE